MAKKAKTPKTPKKRKSIPRETRKFQLRKDHAVDMHVAEILDYKRSKRSEVTAIRDGVRLLWALENGDFSVMLELFPQYKDKIGSGGEGQNQDQIVDLFLERLKTGGYIMASNQPPAPAQSGPRQIAAPTFAMPVFEDDDEPTVIIRQDTSINSAANFVNALKNMQ